MLPKYHIVLGLIIYFILLKYNVNLTFISIFFLASFCFDADHYIYYIFKKKSFNLARAYKYFRVDLNKKLETGKKKIELLFIFHTIEFLIILFALSFAHKILLFVFLGWLFHMSIDWTTKPLENNKKYKRVFSLIYYAIKVKARNKNIKKQKR